MYKISGTKFISLVRGDTFSVPLFINCGTLLRPIRFSLKQFTKSEVYFGVMRPNQPFEVACIRKKYTSDSNINEYGDLMIELNSNDTAGLIPGKYFYEIKLKLDENCIETIVPKTEFFII